MHRLALINIFLCTFIFCLPSYTQEQESNDVANIQTKADKYFKFIPSKNLKSGLKEYMHMLGLSTYGSDDVGGSNAGLAGYSSKLIEKNKCFSEVTSNYYADVQSKTLEKLKAFSKRNIAGYEYMKLDNLSLKSDEPGWAWELALKHAGGDANLAMSIVGVCGHDNTSQLSDVRVEVPEDCDPEKDDCNELQSGYLNFSSKIQKKKYIANKKNMYALLSIINPRLAAEFDQDDLSSDKLEPKGLECPEMGYSFFDQGSLGADTMIADKLSDKIGSIQAPTKGKTYLPSKYYHTIGAAYTTCSLVRNGVPRAVVKKIQSSAINNYRY